MESKCSNCFRDINYTQPVYTDFGIGCCDFQLPHNSKFIPKVIEEQEKVNQVRWSDIQENKEWLERRGFDKYKQ